MKYRQFRKMATGEWLDVLFTVDGDTFSVPEESHRTAIAEALGLPPEALETVEANSDLREGILLELPPPPQIPLAPSQARIQELLAIPRSSWTTAQMRELVELAAQEVLA